MRYRDQDPRSYYQVTGCSIPFQKQLTPERLKKAVFRVTDSLASYPYSRSPNNIEDHCRALAGNCQAPHISPRMISINNATLTLGVRPTKYKPLVQGLYVYVYMYLESQPVLQLETNASECQCQCQCQCQCPYASVVIPDKLKCKISPLR
jgi:hypothetical protein